MIVVTGIQQLRQYLKKYKRRDSAIGFVPTMGYLHEGHLSLVRKARKENMVVVVSIFVNPTQFGEGEDLDVYPRDIQRDETMLKEEEIDFLFYPSVEEMYPEGFSTTVSVAGVTSGYCGNSRPGHFDGVALVVAKLLNIVMPTTAYFGLKDYQQYLTVKRMVKDLDIPCKISGEPIVRESDGLAMSSRNVFVKERDSALSLSKSFNIIQEMLDNGEKNSQKILQTVREFILSSPYTKVDYIEFADPKTLVPVKTLSEPFICLMAVFVESTRLLDNRLFMPVNI